MKGRGRVKGTNIAALSRDYELMGSPSHSLTLGRFDMRFYAASFWLLEINITNDVAVEGWDPGIEKEVVCLSASGRPLEGAGPRLSREDMVTRPQARRQENPQPFSADTPTSILLL